MQSLSDLFADEEENMDFFGDRSISALASDCLGPVYKSEETDDLKPSLDTFHEDKKWQGSCQSFNGNGSYLLNLSCSVSELNASFSESAQKLNSRKQKTNAFKAASKTSLKEEMEMQGRMRKKMAASIDHKPNYFLRVPKLTHGGVGRLQKQESFLQRQMPFIGAPDRETTSPDGEPSSSGDSAGIEGPVRSIKVMQFPFAKSRVISAASTEAAVASPEGDSFTPRKSFRGAVNEMIGRFENYKESENRVFSTSTPVGHWESSERGNDPARKRADSSDSPQRPSRQKSKRNCLDTVTCTPVSPAASLDDISYGEAVVVAPSSPGRGLELFDSCPLVSGVDVKGATEHRRSKSSLGGAESDAAPKRPNRARSPTTSTRNEGAGKQTAASSPGRCPVALSTRNQPSEGDIMISSRAAKQNVAASLQYKSKSVRGLQEKSRSVRKLNKSLESFGSRGSGDKGERKSKESKSRSIFKVKESPSNLKKETSTLCSSGMLEMNTRQPDSTNMANIFPIRRNSGAPVSSRDITTTKNTDKTVSSHSIGNIATNALDLRTADSLQNDVQTVYTTASPRRVRKAFKTSPSCKTLDTGALSKIALPSLIEFHATLSEQKKRPSCNGVPQSPLKFPPQVFKSSTMCDKGIATVSSRRPRKDFQTSASCKQFRNISDISLPPLESFHAAPTRTVEPKGAIPLSPRKSPPRIFKPSSSCRGLNFKDDERDSPPISPRRPRKDFQTAPSCRAMTMKYQNEGNASIYTGRPRNDFQMSASCNTTNDVSLPPMGGTKVAPGESRDCEDFKFAPALFTRKSPPRLSKPWSSCRGLNFKDEEKDIPPVSPRRPRKDFKASSSCKQFFSPNEFSQPFIKGTHAASEESHIIEEHSLAPRKTLPRVFKTSTSCRGLNFKDDEKDIPPISPRRPYKGFHMSASCKQLDIAKDISPPPSDDVHVTAHGNNFNPSPPMLRRKPPPRIFEPSCSCRELNCKNEDKVVSPVSPRRPRKSIQAASKEIVLPAFSDFSGASVARVVHQDAASVAPRRATARVLTTFGSCRDFNVKTQVEKDVAPVSPQRLICR